MKRYCILLSALLPVLLGCGSDKIDVTGQVTSSDGAALAGAKVKVGAEGIVATGPDGTFSIRSVEAPYDLIVASADGRVARVFLGLTRKDPTIVLSVLNASPAPSRTATMTGRISGSRVFSTPSGSPQYFIAPGLDGPRSVNARITDSTLDLAGNYSLTLSWRGPPVLSATFKALQFVGDANAVAMSYDSAAAAPFTVTDGQTSSGVDMTLTPVKNIRLAGTISIAPGYALTQNLLVAAVSPRDSFVLGRNEDATGAILPAFDYPAFSSPLMAATINAAARDSSGTSFVSRWVTARPDASATPVSLPAAPVLQRVQAPATGTPAGDQFSWSAFVEGAVYTLLAFPQNAPGANLEVITGDTSFRMPDLSAMGITVPPSSMYNVTLTAVSPRAVDDIAAGDEFPPRDHDAVLAETTSTLLIP